jgi:Cof subfamily protein (haloacid dehalogenase superfamily)
MNVPQLVALDLDGTTVDAACVIPAAHRATVNDLHQRGVQVALVTGRPLITTRTVHQELRLTTPVVSFNGAWVGQIDGTELASAPLSRQQVRTALAALRPLLGNDSAVGIYPDAERWLISVWTEQTKNFPELYGVPIEHVEGLLNWDAPSLKILVVAPPARVPSMVEVLQDALAGTAHVVISQEDRFEIIQQHVDKSWGLSRLAELLGIPQEQVWAVGDNRNDIEMLLWAGCGFAMGQAPQVVRESADQTLPSIQDAGLQALLEFL